LTGCPFAPRCAYATDICRDETPVDRPVDDEHGQLQHRVSCHHTERLEGKSGHE
jgi:ABC-type dipeptide/oligopeptide/nickel transport system ATPase component